MARILGIDYGTKRIGLAHTDQEQLICSPLDTVSSSEIFNYLTDYFLKEPVESIVVGEPKTLSNEPAKISEKIKKFVIKLDKLFQKPIHMVDERFTSKMAIKTMVSLNVKKKNRRDKKNIDKISAALILQSYLDRKKRNLI